MPSVSDILSLLSTALGACINWFTSLINNEYWSLIIAGITISIAYRFLLRPLLGNGFNTNEIPTSKKEYSNVPRLTGRK